VNVAIVTYHYTANYGAVLQAYGLSRFLQEEGHNVRIVDYRPWQLKTSYLLWGEKCWRHPLALLKARYRFCKFAREYLPLSDRTYYTASSLRGDPPRMDAYICGSDRIWNWYPFPGRHFNSAYFLDFADPRQAALIAYGPSFSRLDIVPEHRPELVRLLMRFSNISARETRGRRIIEDLLGVEVPIVVDPTLLLDATEYRRVMLPARVVDTNEYVFVFNLENSRGFAGMVRRVADATGLPIVAAGYPLVSGAIPAFGSGPAQWLWLLSNARYVCTNSYHGVLFSLIFRKQFLVYPRAYSNSRLETILKEVGLEDRFARDGTMPSLAPVNYDDVHQSLNSSIRFSRGFLTSALHDLPHG